MKRSAFTLVELSIVLIIIGLIVGGILAGADMIRAAKLRSVISDVQQYKTAINVFRDKYNAFPGDMRNATDFWGTDSLGCPSGGGAGTCDGDGDRTIDHSAERHRAWEQLSLAEIIPDTYTGIVAPGTPKIIPGTNAPILQVSGETGSGGIGIHNQGIGEVRNEFVPSQNYFLVGAYGSTSGSLWRGLFTPSESHSIEQKIDDGKASSGKVIARDGQGGADCIDVNTELGVYVLSTTDRDCIFYVSFP